MTTEDQVKPTDVDKALLGTATYRSLGEQRLSPQEERFEKGPRTVGLFLAPLVTVVFLVLPIDIPREQQVLAAVLLGVIVLWISEAVPIPVGGLLGVAVAVFLGVAPVDDVLGPFGSSTIFTFIGAFILAQAMLKHGVARRFALRILALPRAGRSTTGVIIAFVITVTLWILPGVVALITGTESDVYEFVSDRLDEGVVAVFGASLLFLLPTDWKEREFTLRWSDATQIDWGTIILFGTGIIFGSLIADTGLAETIGTSVNDALGLGSSVAITIFAVLLAILVSETTSNTASAAVVVPIVIPVAMAAGINPFGPALAATFAASFGFMLPVSTPQNAIVYGSGVVPITTMIRSGVIFDIAGAFLIILLLPLMVSVLGLGG